MRYHLAVAALLLPLAGCYVPPADPYGYPASGYPAAYGQTLDRYPGYAYNDGSPTIIAEGGTWPLTFYGGGWGYWDGRRNWHRAPDSVWRHLDTQHPGGVGYRPWGGGGFVGHQNFPPGGHTFTPQAGGFRPGQTPGIQRTGVPAAHPAGAPNQHDRHRDDRH